MIEIKEFTVEHMYGAATRRGIVKLSMTTVDDELGAVEQLTPDQARTLASDLFYAAARAEYDQDLMTEFQSKGMPDEVAAMALFASREGERHRMGGGR